MMQNWTKEQIEKTPSILDLVASLQETYELQQKYLKEGTEAYYTVTSGCSKAELVQLQEEYKKLEVKARAELKNSSKILQDFLYGNMRAADCYRTYNYYIAEELARINQLTLF